MSWWEVSIACDNQQADNLSEKLQALGALAVSFMDLSGNAILEPAPGEAPLWEKIKCVGLFDQTVDQKTLHNKIATLNMDFDIALLPDQDWVKICQEHFQPQQFGDKLWVCPSWSTPPDDAAILLKLDPGLAFGTGTHPTTALCLDYLASNPQSHKINNKCVIDFGCGSGILGIAAALLGAKQVIAVDHDPQALVSTELNAEQNKVKDKLTCYHSNQFPDRSPNATPVLADLLVANILALPLIHLAQTISHTVKSGGTLVLSGLLSKQIDSVLSAYIDHFDFETPRLQDDWVCLVGTKI